MQPFKGVRVVQVADSIAASYCAKLFADLGADVINVEPIDGDRIRKTPPLCHRCPTPHSTLDVYLNTNKRSVTLDIAHDEGKTLLRALVGTAQLVVESCPAPLFDELTRDGVLPTDGSVVSVMPFGRTGPYLNVPATPTTVYAMGGYMYTNGEPDREPLSPRNPIGEYQTGLHAFVGAVASLLGGTNGRFSSIDVGSLECWAAIHQVTTQQYFVRGEVKRRSGNRHGQALHPITLYRCSDGYISVNAVDQSAWQGMTVALDMPNLITDERFSDSVMRRVNADELDSIISPWFEARSREQAFHQLRALDVPCDVVREISDIVDDTGLEERGFWHVTQHAATSVRMPRGPFSGNDIEWRYEESPTLGEHNEDVYKGLLGLCDRDYQRLRTTGVI